MKALCDYPEQRAIWQRDFERRRTDGRRGDRPLGDAGDPLPPHRYARHRGPRPEDRRAGDKVVLWYNSANRDEDVFRDPSASTSSASRTSTSASADPGRTSASGRISPAARSPSCSASSSDGYPTSRSRRRRSASTLFFIHGLKHMRCTFGREARPPERSRLDHDRRHPGRPAARAEPDAAAERGVLRDPELPPAGALPVPPQSTRALRVSTEASTGG